MCGRYNLSGYAPFEDIAELLEKAQGELLDFKTEGEIFPGDCVAVLANNKKRQQAAFAMRWGYTDDVHHRLVVNARSETAAEKPLFMRGMAQHRCLIPATSYVEWEKQGKQKIRYSIVPKGTAQGFFFAGIYRMEQMTPHFVILTQEPAEEIRFIHNRMPVMLPMEARGDWLNLEYAAGDVLKSAVTCVRYQRADGEEQLRFTV